MKQWPLGLAWLCVVAAIVGFFLPWAQMEVRKPGAGLLDKVKSQTEGTAVGGAVGDVLGGLKKGLTRVTGTVRRGAEQVTGELDLNQIPNQITGFQIPQLANSENAKMAMIIMELLTQSSQHIGLKSYAVYLLPGLALCFGLLLTLFGNTAPLPWAVAALSGAIAGIGFWKLLTTNTEALFLAVAIGPGVWLSLWAYAGIAVAAVALVLSRTKPAAR